LTLRGNFNVNVFDVTKERNWLNKLDVQVNLSYARVKNAGLDVNSQWGNEIGSALALPPVIAPYVTGQDAQDQIDYYSSTYSDTGYLFLMVDMNDAKQPIIKVRTWQPERDPNINAQFERGSKFYGLFYGGNF
jgi:hypothetical protein